jgi:hypothetical protein
LALLAPLFAWAGDTSPPARDFATTVSAFPWPATEHAFDVRGRITAEEDVVGTFRLAARVEQAKPAPRWRLVETRETTFADVRLAHEASALTRATLHPLSGILVEEDELGDRLRHAWEEEEGVYRVRTSGESRQAMARTAAQEGPCLTSLAALVLFGRLVKPESATYETRLFHPGWNYLEAERPFVTTRLRVDAPGDAEDDDLILTAEQERARIRIVLDLDTRDLRELGIEERGRPTLVLRPGPTEDAQPADDLFAAPSASPRGCAARVALAFATVDVTLFEALIHWPTLRANMRSSVTGTVTDEAFRASILGQFRTQGAERTPQARADAEAFLRTEADGFAVDAVGDAGAVVTLSQAWGGMRLTLCRREGAWYLARLPGR